MLLLNIREKTQYRRYFSNQKGHGIPSIFCYFKSASCIIKGKIKKGPNAGQLSRPYIDSDSTTLLLKEMLHNSRWQLVSEQGYV